MATNEDRSRAALEKLANSLDKIERHIGSTTRAFLLMEKTLNYWAASSDQNLQRIIAQLEIANEPYDLDKMTEVQEDQNKTAQSDYVFTIGDRVRIIDHTTMRHLQAGEISRRRPMNFVDIAFDNDGEGEYHTSQLELIPDTGFGQHGLEGHVCGKVCLALKELRPEPNKFTQEPRGTKLDSWVVAVGKSSLNAPDPYKMYDSFIAWVFEEAARNEIDPTQINFVSGKQAGHAILRSRDSWTMSSQEEPRFEVRLPKDVPVPDEAYLRKLQGPPVLTVAKFEERKHMMLAYPTSPPRWVIGAQVMVVDPTSMRHRQIGLVEELHEDCVDLRFSGGSGGDFNYYKVGLISNTTPEERAAQRLEKKTPMFSEGGRYVGEQITERVMLGEDPAESEQPVAQFEWETDEPCPACARPKGAHSTDEMYACKQTIQYQQRQEDPHDDTRD